MPHDLWFRQIGKTDDIAAFETAQTMLNRRFWQIDAARPGALFKDAAPQ